MAKTVGMSAAIGVELILRGDVLGRGVLTPTTPDIYHPALARLESEGIRFVEKMRIVNGGP
jgi:alpha-aminoadipic semialdehyde synthase